MPQIWLILMRLPSQPLNISLVYLARIEINGHQCGRNICGEMTGHRRSKSKVSSPEFPDSRGKLWLLLVELAVGNSIDWKPLTACECRRCNTPPISSALQAQLQMGKPGNPSETHQDGVNEAVSSRWEFLLTVSPTKYLNGPTTSSWHEFRAVSMRQVWRLDKNDRERRGQTNKT